MSTYVQISDFDAQSQTAKDIFTVVPLQKYIDKFEVRYLQELLGSDLYEEFKTDFAILGNAPTDPKFVAIWESFCIDSHAGNLIRSEGIKEMLTLFIYFEYLRDQKVKNNIAGPQVNVQANSISADYQATNIYTNYNEALESYCNIQWYIVTNPDGYDYDNYNGQNKQLISFA